MEEPMTASVDSGESNCSPNEQRQNANGLRRNKVSRACDECRKRKVRCNGAQPCERCQKSGAACVFNKVTLRRSSPKQYVDTLEPRLRALERALDTLVDPLDTMRTRWPTSTMLPSTLEPLLTDSDLAQQNPNYVPDIRKDLIHLYFTHVHPYLPILHKDAFLTQHYTSPLLLNAVYAVASRWLTGGDTSNQKPAGWHFFEHAFQLLDTFADAPRLSTIQALLLLLKYQEHLRRPGFFCRTRMYFDMIFLMCKELGLTHELPNEFQMSHVVAETRRRTFWAVYIYDILMSTEYGSTPHFDGRQCTIQCPNFMTDEFKSDDGEAIWYFYRLTDVARLQGSILQFVRQNRPLEQGETFQMLQQQLNDVQAHLSTVNQTPGLVHPLTLSFCTLLVHHSTIILHRPFSDHASSNEKCTHSAAYIIHMAQKLSHTSLDWVFYPLRGVQYVIHALSASLSIYKSNTDMSDQAMLLVNLLLGLTPAVEILTAPSTSHTDSPSQPSSSRSMPLLAATNDNSGRTRSRRSSNVASTASGKRRARANVPVNTTTPAATARSRPMATHHHRLSMPVMLQAPPMPYQPPYMINTSQLPLPTTTYTFNDTYNGTSALSTMPSNQPTSFYKQALQSSMVTAASQHPPYPPPTMALDSPERATSTPMPTFTSSRPTSPRRHTFSGTLNQPLSFSQAIPQWTANIPVSGEVPMDTSVLNNADTSGTADGFTESMVDFLMGPTMPWAAM